MGFALLNHEVRLRGLAYTKRDRSWAVNVENVHALQSAQADFVA